MSMSVKYILAPALVCTLMHLALLLGDGEGSTNGALGMVQAVLSCVVLLASGLLPALQILLRGRPDRDSSSESGTRAEVGIFALLVLALGLGLLLQFLLALVLRAVAPPLTAWPMAALALGSLLLIVGIGTRRGWPRVRTEPGLGGLALVLALLITVIVAIAAGPRLFDGPERMVLMSGKHWVDMLTGHGPPPLPVGVTVAPVRGLEQLEPGHYQATHPNICLGITNTLGREVKGALRLVASGRPDLDLHLLGVIPGACGGCKSPTAGGSPSASVSLPSTI